MMQKNLSKETQKLFTKDGVRKDSVHSDIRKKRGTEKDIIIETFAVDSRISFFSFFFCKTKNDV